MSALSRSALHGDLLRGTFAGVASGSLSPRRIGAEVEFIPVESSTGRRCAIDDHGVVSTLPFLRRFGARQGWKESCTSKGTPCFFVPNGGSITFEPGGQLEYSSPPCRSASALLAQLRAVVLPLRSEAGCEGIDLLACGIDPVNSLEMAPLLIHAERYQRMAEYFATRSSAGGRMMRQTASFQVSLDFGDEPWLVWRVLNAVAPYVIAIFANSPMYDGVATGAQSTRAAVWREVDPSRTGLPYDERQPVDAYLEFALAAPAFLSPTVEGGSQTFAEWLTRANPGMEDWHQHLSTLFPEARPRGPVELRSADALPPEWYAAPLALAAGLIYEPGALRAANDLLGTPNESLLDQAGRHGLHDSGIARTAVDLVDIALSGCRRLGEAYFHPGDLEQAVSFFDQYTRRGRALSDDVMDRAIAA